MWRDLIKVLGKDANSREIKATLKRLGFTTTRPSPPSRTYHGAPKLGAEMISEDDRLTDITLYIQPMKPYSAYAGDLPCGLLRDMKQLQVHELLGAPQKATEYRSRFLRPELGIVLTVRFDLKGTMETLGMALPS